MNSQKLGLIAFVLTGLALGSDAAASEVNFDDVPFPGGNPTAASTLSAGYQGFNWGGGRGVNSWVVSPNDATGWYGGTREPYSHSGNNFAWNNGGTDLEITAPGGGRFDLESFWIRSWPNASFDVTARGYLNGAEVFTRPFTTTDIYAQVAANFGTIDRFTLTLAAPRSLLLDDIRITAVPGPGALLTGLVGSAPGVYLLLRRRSQRRTRGAA